MRRLALLATLGLVALVAPAAVGAPLTIADVGAWCWFGDPRAVEHDGRAVFGWVADDGSIMVGDDRGERFALAPQLQRDDHDNPSFYVRQDGRLMAFWTAHSGDALRYRVATDGIAAWGPTRTGPANPPGVSQQYTYPNPRRAGNTLFLFWSGTENTATFATSPDDGDSWSPARTLFRTGGEAVRYIKYATDGDAIHLAWTLVHPRWVRGPVFHAVIRDGRIERLDGTRIGTLGQPIDPRAGDLVYDEAADGGAWIHDLEVVDGQPVIVFATFPTLQDHAYHYATWRGGRWVDERITSAGPSFDTDVVQPENEYSGGVNLDPADPRVVWLSRQVDGQFEIERWTRFDTGWVRETVTSGSTAPNVRPYPLGRGVAWMRGDYPGFTSFRTALVWLPQAPPPAVEPQPRQPPPPEAPPLPPSPAATAPARPAPPRAARPVCDRFVTHWRRTHRRGALAGYWRCQASHGRCALVRRAAKRSAIARTVHRARCAKARRPRPAGPRGALR